MSKQFTSIVVLAAALLFAVSTHAQFGNKASALNRGAVAAKGGFNVRQIAVDGKPVDIYSVDGKLVRSKATSLDGLKGLYIVNGKKVMVK